MAEETVSTTAVVGLLSEEAPVDGDTAGVTQDGLYHAPGQQQEQDVEHHQQDDVRCRLQVDHVLVHEHEVVERDEHQHPYEVRVDELPAADFPITHQLLDDYNLKLNKPTCLHSYPHTINNTQSHHPSLAVLLLFPWLGAADIDQ